MRLINHKTLKYKTLALTIALMFVSGHVIAESSLQPFQIAQTSTAVKQNSEYWMDQGWELQAAGKHEEAIQAFRKAEAMGAGSDEVKFAIAESYRGINRNRDAYNEYEKVLSSNNPENRITACQEMDDLMGASDKSLPDPYFADLSTTIGWQSDGDMGYIDLKGRLGVETAGDLSSQLYLFAAYARDNRSGIVAGLPDEYYTNEAIAGVGFNTDLTEHLSFWAEAGRGRNLLDVAPADKEFNDLRGGFEYSRDYNTDLDCRSNDKYPNRFILKTYADLIYYDRDYDNNSINVDSSTWFSAEVKPGIRVYETPKSTVDAMLLFNTNHNLDNGADNYNQAGVEIKWYPNRRHDYSITATAVETFYMDDVHNFNFILELNHYMDL